MEIKSRHPGLSIFLRICCMLLLAGCATSELLAEQTASQLIASCNAKIRQAGGISAIFSMTSGNQSTNGSLKTTGSKFVIDTPTASTWYDGNSMWTYNSRTKETTVVKPTPAELAETNPLLLISSKISQFSVSYAKNRKAGCMTVVLTPKTKGTGIKSMHIDINAKTNLPEKLVAVPASGQTISITLSSIKTAQKYTDATFVYPKSKYPKATIVDLR